MRTTSLLFILTLLGWSFALPASAQRGMGDASGVARKGVAWPVETMSGTVASIEIGACELTTGRASQGVHLHVDTDQGERINLHLGPLFALEYVADRVGAGMPIEFDAFRTDALPDDAFIAKTLRYDDDTVHLRDDTLRPMWAYGRGMGRGRGMGAGHGRGCGHCW